MPTKDLFEPFPSGPVIGRDANQAIRVDEIDSDQLAAEQSLATRKDLVEDRRRVGDGAADGRKDLAGRPLLFEGLFGLVEQADVLDGDHGLIGKGPEQRDFVVRKRSHLLAADQERAERAFLRERAA